jgi:hypothetical protein
LNGGLFDGSTTLATKFESTNCQSFITIHKTISRSVWLEQVTLISFARKKVLAAAVSHGFLLLFSPRFG